MFHDEFYPTPKGIISKMVQPYREKLKDLTILEPSAGKGDILDYIIDCTAHYERPDLYCIEIDKNLQHILREKDYKVIAEDFLTYSGDYYFDLILMNPPFSNGADHLLKAWEVIKEGEICCLLNEETYNNPYTEKRKLLKNIIDEHGTVEHLGPCFSSGVERVANVNVIMVRLTKEEKNGTFDFEFEKVSDEKHFAINEDTFTNQVAVRDVIGNMEIQYTKLKEIFVEHLKVLDGLDFYKQGLLPEYANWEDIMKVSGSKQKKYNQFADNMKKAIWRKIITEMKMDRYMTNNVQKNFSKFIDQQGAMDFTRENVFSMINTLFANKENILKQAIVDVFDIFTKYYDENRCHVEGWKTNDMWKVNRKIILPYWVKYGEYMNSYDLRKHGDRIGINWNMNSEYADIDKVMCYLTGFNYESCRTLYSSLDNHLDSLGYIKTGDKFQNTGESTFFKYKFFKKGTLHIEFKDKELWHKFNIAACEGKNWLPPQQNKAA